MCSLVCKIKKSKKNSPEREKIEKKNKKKDVSQIVPLTDENKEKNAENLKKRGRTMKKQIPGE